MFREVQRSFSTLQESLNLSFKFVYSTDKYISSILIDSRLNIQVTLLWNILQAADLLAKGKGVRIRSKKEHTPKA